MHGHIHVVQVYTCIYKTVQQALVKISYVGKPFGPFQSCQAHYKAIRPTLNGFKMGQGFPNKYTRMYMYMYLMLDVVSFKEFEEFLVSSDVTYQPAIVPYLIRVIEGSLSFSTAHITYTHTHMQPLHFRVVFRRKPL